MILKPHARIVDIVLGIWQRVPAPVIHNLSKARMLKLIFWHLAVDQKPGFYLEFGVAHGHSMRAAILANEFGKNSQLNVARVDRLFYGIDTFEGFSSDNPIDGHPVWHSDSYTKPISEVRNRFKSFGPTVSFFKIDANDFGMKTNSEIERLTSRLDGFAAVILFDMDLYNPTARALEWIEPYIQEGTFLLFDEFFAFGGSLKKGEARAVEEFKARHPKWILRDFSSYGSGGKCFVVSRVCA